MNPENKHGQGVLPGMAGVRLTEAQIRFCQLMAVGFDEDGKKINQGDCAIKAGLGNNATSSKALASRYMKDQRFKLMIGQLRTEAMGDLKLHNNEIIQGMRDLAAISLGKQSVKRTVFNKAAADDGSVVSVAKTFSVYEPDLGQAHQALKTMGTITGLITDKQKVEHSGGFALAGILSDIDGKTDGLPEG